MGLDILILHAYCPCVMLCDLTSCYSIESAWFRFKLEYDKLVSNFAFSFNFRHYCKDDKAAVGARKAATVARTTEEENQIVTLQRKAGGSSRTSTRPTLNLHLLIRSSV